MVAIVAPLAGGLTTLLLNMWDIFANRRKTVSSENADYRDELRKDIERKDKELAESREQIQRQHDYENSQEREIRLWQQYYFELFSMYYPLRIIVGQLPEGQGQLAKSSLGLAPHERAALDTPGDA